MVVDRISKFLGDAESFEALIGCMLSDDRRVYLAYKALYLESAFPNRQMVVYTLEGGEPCNVTRVSFGGMTLSEVDGLVVEVAVGSKRMRLGPVPAMLPGRDLFMQVPQHFELKWKGKYLDSGALQFTPHYAVLIKTRSKEFQQVDGDTYCATLNKFRERFPDLQTRY